MYLRANIYQNYFLEPLRTCVNYQNLLGTRPSSGPQFVRSVKFAQRLK